MDMDDSFVQFIQHANNFTRNSLRTSWGSSLFKSFKISSERCLFEWHCSTQFSNTPSIICCGKLNVTEHNASSNTRDAGFDSAISLGNRAFSRKHWLLAKLMLPAWLVKLSQATAKLASVKSETVYEVVVCVVSNEPSR